MRELARLLQQMQMTTKCTTMRQFLTAQNYRSLVKATKNLSQFGKKNQVGKPGLALSIGPKLKLMARMARRELIEKGKREEAKEYKDFHEMMKEWGEDVAAIALRNKKQKRARKPLPIPTAEDVRKFFSFLQDKEIKYRRQLGEKRDNLSAYENLAKVIMAKLTLFATERGTVRLS